MFFWGILEFKKDIDCPNLSKYLVSADVTVLETTPLFPSIDRPSRGEDDDLFIYTVTSSISDLTESVIVKPPMQPFILGDVSS